MRVRPATADDPGTTGTGSPSARTPRRGGSRRTPAAPSPSAPASTTAYLTRAGPPGHRVRRALLRAATAPTARRLVTQRYPPAEIPGLDPGRLIPRHADRPPEPEPPQQIHRIRPLRRDRTARRLQLLQEHRHSRNGSAFSVDQSDRIPHILRRLDRTHPRDHQRSQIAIVIAYIDHGGDRRHGTYPNPATPRSASR